MSSNLLKDKSVIITGIASGIGRAAAVVFARAGARLTLADVDAAGGEETLALVREIGGEAQFVATDVSDAAAVEAMVARAVAAYGGLDCAFNNAGVLLEKSQIEDSTYVGWEEATFERTWRINVKGVMLCMKHQIRQMLKQGRGGAIVNTSSVEGFRGTPGHPAYSASKHAVLGLTRVAALEVGRNGIRVNAVCPGVIHTPMAAGSLEKIGQDNLAALHALGRIGEPEEVAQAALWLCSPGASFITGHPLPVDGGMLA